MSLVAVRAMLRGLKIRVRALKRDVHAISLASHHPRVPWYAKVLALAVAGYALSPIDLIPDFIPVFGYLDDLIIVPLGIWLVLSLIPDDVIAEVRAQGRAASARQDCRDHHHCDLDFGGGGAGLARAGPLGSTALRANADSPAPSARQLCKNA